MEFNDKTILVTGGSSGIGEAIALEFARAGAKMIFINYRKSADKAAKVVEKLAALTQASAYQGDLSDKMAVENMFSEIKKSHDTIDILVNNAGESIPGDIADYNLWDYQFKNNFFSAVYTTNEFLKFTEKQKSQRKIINITSMYGLFEMGDTDFIHYSAAKAALNSYTFNLARKLGNKVLVNAVAPGWTITPAWDGTPEDAFKHCEELMTIKRFITAEEVAQLVVAIAKNDAITGEIYKIDGGVKSPVI